MINLRYISRLLTRPNSHFATVSRCLFTTPKACQKENADKSSIKVVEQDLQKAHQEQTDAVDRKQETTDLIKYELPDESSVEPKKLVFQRLVQTRIDGAVYTLEEAAKPTTHVADTFYAEFFKYPSATSNMGKRNYALRSYQNEHSVVIQFPDVTDFLLLGAGLLSSATAYYIKRYYNWCLDVAIIDKDPMGRNGSTAISNGLISAQSKSEDVVRLAQLSKELIRVLKDDIICTDEDFAKINYRPVSHLVFYTEDQAEDVLEAVRMQSLNNCYTEMALPDQLERVFPFLSVQDSNVSLGTYGEQDEALVDPIALRNLYRTLGHARGANYIKAEAIDFNTKYRHRCGPMNEDGLQNVMARIDSGELSCCNYGRTLVSLGHNTPFFEAQAEFPDYKRESYGDLHFLTPRMRLIFTFNSMAAPVINFPVITDVDGSQLICEDFSGTFKYYATLGQSQEVFEEDMDKFMDLDGDEPYVSLFHKDESMRNYFDQVIKPNLVKRIPLMEDAKFMFVQSGFENWNSLDGSPILGEHPGTDYILLTGGLGNRMLNYAPAIALAYMEQMAERTYKTFDITNFSWNRAINGQEIAEFPQLLGGFERL